MVDLSAPLEVYAFALVPALLWGFEPIVSRRGLAAGGTPLQASVVVVAVDSTMYWLALAAFGGLGAVAALPTDVIVLFAAAGVVGTAIGRLAVFEGIRRVGASVSSAVVSSRPLFAAAFAVGALGEAVTTTTAAGVVVLAGGLVTLSMTRGGDVDGWQSWHLLFPLAAAAAFGLGNVVRRYGLQTTDATALGAVAINETAALVAVVAYVVARGRVDDVRAPRRTYGLFAVSGVLTGVALLGLFLALDLPGGRVVVVDPLVASAPLFTVAFAAVLLRDVERVDRRVVAGAALVVAGAALVTIG